MQMRRQEGPLGKPMNLANLPKMANWSKFPTTWKPMQMGVQEAPLEKPANLGKFGNVVEIADNLQANVREQTRGPLGNLVTFV